MELSSDLYHGIVQRLEGHQQSLRIKKLMFYICQNKWENDPNTLRAMPWAQLLPQVIQAKPELNQLALALYNVVKTLNRPQLYANVAKIIIDELQPLYSTDDSEVPTQIIAGQANESEELDQNLSPEVLISQIANYLERHPENQRMKKLIFAVCQNRWENNINVINSYGLTKLIADMRQLNPTKFELQQSFQKIVSNINKKNLYWAITNIIIHQVDCLYEEGLPESSTSPSDNHVQTLYDQAESYPVESLPPNVPQQQTVATLQPLADGKGTTVIDLSQLPVSPNPQQVNPPPPSPPQKKEYNIFDVRAEIMQYTNILRAKVLLFSVLFHDWDRGGQDWSTLRGYLLDDLLEQLLHSGLTLSAIKVKLQGAVNNQEDQQSYAQTAGIIMETIKNFI